MDRRATAHRFRERLAEAMSRAQFNRSTLAGRVGIDRSTLSQLLSSDTDRLPRADTVAAIALALHVSLDWLLGLSHEAKRGADILHESIEVTPSPRGRIDESLARWYSEAVGYKIRHVPATLPDLVKTEDVLDYEYRDFVARTTDEAIATSHGRLAYVRMPETDMEIGLPRQAMESFANGEGVWRELSADARRRQLDHMIDLIEELYPTQRIFFFNGRTHYSAPYTVFGPQRAAVYVGQMYLAFNTIEHVRVLTRHFDQLVRAAVVPAHEAADFLRGLRGGG